MAALNKQGKAWIRGVLRDLFVRNNKLEDRERLSYCQDTHSPISVFKDFQTLCLVFHDFHGLSRPVELQTAFLGTQPNTQSNLDGEQKEFLTFTRDSLTLQANQQGAAQIALVRRLERPDDELVGPLGHAGGVR